MRMQDHFSLNHHPFPLLMTKVDNCCDWSLIEEIDIFYSTTYNHQRIGLYHQGYK
ncbi:hypothetical protein CsatB_017023 [Cannabis sativa]